MPRCFETSSSQHYRILCTDIATGDGDLISNSHVSRISTHIADCLQRIQIRDGLCTIEIHVFSSFRCRLFPKLLMWIFMHRQQRSASAWDEDFVNVSDRFSLVGTLTTFKHPSCTARGNHKKRTSSCRVFTDHCRTHTPLAALLAHRM